VNRYHTSLINLFRISLAGLILVLFHLLAPHSYAMQPSPGSWTHLGLNNLTVWTLVSDPTNPNKLYAGTSDGVYQSTDAGSTWTVESNQGTPALVVAISPTNNNILYATHGSTGIQKSIDGGNTWIDVTNNLGTPTIILDLAINPTDPNTVIVAPYGHCLGIRKTTDGGTTWNAVGGGCDIYRIAYDPTNQNIIYAGGTNFSGYIAKSTDGGDTWTLGSDPNHLGNDGVTGAVHGIVVDPNNSNNVYVGQEISGIYKTTTGGSDWNLLPNSPSVPIDNALAINPLDSSIYAKSSNGVSESSDGGNTWSAINTGDTPSGIEKLIILPNDPNNLYAATDTGVYAYGLQKSDVAPSINTISNATINEGDTYTTNGSFTDSDSTSWTATVDYGDGSGTQPLTLSGTNFSLSHTYTTTGTFTVKVSITDNQGATGTGTATVTVTDTDLGLTNMPANITTNATSSQGAIVTYTLPTVVDEDNPLPTVSCTPASGSTFPIGTTTVTCTVSDSDDTPSTASQTFTITVNDSDLGLINMPANITINATSPQGAAVTYTSPTATDESGDSPAATVRCTPASGSTFAIGTTTVTCSATDSDDTNSPVSQSFTVTVKPVLTTSGKSVSTMEGSAFSGVVATGTDYGAGTLSATITWGDGSSSAGSVILATDGTYSVTGSHTYVEEGSSLIFSVQVSASGGLNATGNSSAAVADAALSASTPTTVIKGNTLTLTTTFIDADPNGTASDYTANIMWGDNTSSTATIGSSGPNFSAIGNHKYAKHGTYTVTMTIKDSGGSSVTKTLTITA